MSLLLQIETATSVCSVALSLNGDTIALKERNEPNIHASQLTLFIKEVMEQANLTFQQLDGVAVSMGPGSYTGLRIGVSTAKGLCFALDRPLIAVHTLKMMANGFITNNKTNGLICPMIDARRMEVFTAIYKDDLTEIEKTSAQIIDEHSYINLLDRHKVVFIGNGAEKCAAVIQHPNATFVSANFNSAAYISTLAHDAFVRKQFEDVAYFEPFYLKDFVFTTPKSKPAL